MPLSIVLTNDDGFDAPGIQSLYSALVAAGYDVHIVAPKTNQSAQGSSLGGTAAIDSPVTVTEFSPGNYYVDGRPGVATRAAIDTLFADNPPDLVISGTNKGDNTGESENISGTVNGAVAALDRGIPAIAVSAGSDPTGSYTNGFANAANITVELVQRLEAAKADGQPLLPAGEGLSVNVPGGVVKGVTVTTIDQESSATYPIGQLPSGLYNSTFTPSMSSGNPLSEGAQFLAGNATISAIDGNWAGTESQRAQLETRLSGVLDHGLKSAPGLKVMLVDASGANSIGIQLVRLALLANGDDVTVVAPATDQTGTGSALTLQDFKVTPITGGYTVAATPSTTVETGLDALLTGDDRPDLVVSGADPGSSVGLQGVTSATLAAAAEAVFNYGIPEISLNVGTDSSGNVSFLDYAKSALFLLKVVDGLEATEPSNGSLLPSGEGISINVPHDASLDNYAFTLSDEATSSILKLLPSGSGTDQLRFIDGPAVNTDALHSEGTAYNGGAITITPIDGSFQDEDFSATQALADLVGTRLGQAAPLPDFLTGSQGAPMAALHDASMTGSPLMMAASGT